MRSLSKRVERLKRYFEGMRGDIEIPGDPVEFAIKLFNFRPTAYQERLLRDSSKRIAVKWCRQAGKTSTIALRAIWFALTHPKTLTLIVAPSLRQSMIMSDKIHDFLNMLPIDLKRRIVLKLQRTVITFTNGSRIIALPNSPQLLRGYTANQVICDESAFFRDDELIFYNVLYPMLATTDGVLIASSTPWSTDSVFYKMCNDPAFSKHFITWRDVVEAGLVKKEFIDEMMRLLPHERFQREFEAQFVEDADAWLPQSLIASCIDPFLQPYDFCECPQGNFYVGVDFGKHQDYSVVAVVEKQGDLIKLVHLHRFPLETEYASVIGYLKSLSGRWQTIRAIYADVTGVGDYIVEEMKRCSLMQTVGIKFTVEIKEEMATLLKAKMREKKFLIPYEPVKKRTDIDLCSELNVERFELMKTGRIRFYCPDRTHDDVFWAITLAVYAASREAILQVDTGRTWQ